MNFNIRNVLSIAARSAIETNIDPISYEALRYRKYNRIKNLSSNHRTIAFRSRETNSPSIYTFSRCFNPYSIDRLVIQCEDDEEEYEED